MGVTSGWLDWAERDPGPADKVYRQENAAIGYIPHSMVGWMAGWRSRLFSTDRREDGRYTPYAAASVHGAILLNGSVIQHYPFTASCWASGSFAANTQFVAFENEGGPPGKESEPFTDEQVTSNVRIIRELAAWKGWTPRRPTGKQDRGATLYEHRECVRFGSAPTACPSGRIPWATILRRLERDDMADLEELHDEMKEGFLALKTVIVLRARQVDAVLEELRDVCRLQTSWLDEHVRQHGDTPPPELAERVDALARRLGAVTDISDGG